MCSAPKNPRVKEIWYVDFYKESAGNEIDAIGSKKDNARPAIVISDPLAFSFDTDKRSINDLRIVIPLKSHWEPEYERIQWFDKINKTQKNGLKNNSTAEIYQIRSCDIQRFQKHIGVIDTEKFKQLLGLVSVCIGMNTYYEIKEKTK